MNAVKTNDAMNEFEPLAKTVVQGAVSGAVSLFCSLLEGVARINEEKREQEREARRYTLRTRIEAGEKIKKKEMLMVLHWTDGTKQEIADEIKLPLDVVKKATKAWWNFL